MMIHALQPTIITLRTGSNFGRMQSLCLLLRCKPAEGAEGREERKGRGRGGKGKRKETCLEGFPKVSEASRARRFARPRNEILYMRMSSRNAHLLAYITLSCEIIKRPVTGIDSLSRGDDDEKANGEGTDDEDSEEGRQASRAYSSGFVINKSKIGSSSASCHRRPR